MTLNSAVSLSLSRVPLVALIFSVASHAPSIVTAIIKLMRAVARCQLVDCGERTSHWRRQRANGATDPGSPDLVELITTTEATYDARH